MALPPSMPTAARARIATADAYSFGSFAKLLMRAARSLSTLSTLMLRGGVLSAGSASRRVNYRRVSAVNTSRFLTEIIIICVYQNKTFAAETRQGR